MGKLPCWIDAMNWAEGKAVAAAFALLLVLSLGSVPMLADAAFATESDSTIAGEVIEDDATALGAFDEPHCWVHWLMALGIVATVGYGVAATGRRLGHTRRIEGLEAALIGGEAPASSAEATAPAAVKLRS